MKSTYLFVHQNYQLELSPSLLSTLPRFEFSKLNLLLLLLFYIWWCCWLCFVGFALPFLFLYMHIVRWPNYYMDAPLGGAVCFVYNIPYVCLLVYTLSPNNLVLISCSVLHRSTAICVYLCFWENVTECVRSYNHARLCWDAARVAGAEPLTGWSLGTR